MNETIQIKHAIIQTGNDWKYGKRREKKQHGWDVVLFLTSKGTAVRLSDSSVRFYDFAVISSKNDSTSPKQRKERKKKEEKLVHVAFCRTHTEHLFELIRHVAPANGKRIRKFHLANFISLCRHVTLFFGVVIFYLYCVFLACWIVRCFFFRSSPVCVYVFVDVHFSFFFVRLLLVFPILFSSIFNVFLMFIP